MTFWQGFKEGIKEFFSISSSQKKDQKPSIMPFVFFVGLLAASCGWYFVRHEPVTAVVFLCLAVLSLVLGISQRKK